MMLKILIVDDEYFFRQSLKILLPYESIGLNICGEAKNGQEGLEMVRLHKPDIVIVDITMPVMGGLDMIKIVRDSGYNTKFIILTGYEEFQFARTAVNLGVDEYLIKPIEANELKSSLLKLKQEVEYEEQKADYVQSLQCKMTEMIPLVTRDFLEKLFNGYLFLNHDKIKGKLEDLKLNIASPPYFVVAFSGTGAEEDETEELGWEANFYDNVCGALADVFPCCYMYFSYLAVNKYVIVVFSQVLDEKQEEIAKKLEITLDVLFSKGLQTTAGISESFNNLTDCSRGMQQAVFAVKNNVIYGSQSIIYYKNVSCRYSEGFIITTEIKGRLLMALRSSTKDEIEELLNRIFLEFIKTPINADILKIKCGELLSVCGEFLRESRLDEYDIPEPEDFLQNVSSLMDIKGKMIAFFLEIMQFAKTNKNSRSERIITEIKRLIEDNYSNSEFKLSQISKILYLNYSHICHVFSQYTGTTIGDYLTEVRVMKAKELFDGGIVSVSSVSQKVGYTDANYFGKCFKKKYGVSPNKYCLLHEKN